MRKPQRFVQSFLLYSVIDELEVNVRAQLITNIRVVNFFYEIVRVRVASLRGYERRSRVETVALFGCGGTLGALGNLLAFVARLLFGR